MKNQKTQPVTAVPSLRIAYLNLDKTKQLGIDNIKTSFDIVIEVSDLAVSLSQKFDYRKMFAFAFKLAEYGNIVDILREALAEFKDLTAAESELVAAHFKDRFDIENDELEARIERGIDLIQRGYELAPLAIQYGGDLAEYVGSWKNDLLPIAA